MYLSAFRVDLISLPESASGMFMAIGRNVSLGMLCFSFLVPAGWMEIIETLWSTLNIVSGSTQGMSSPHHQELLDFQMNDSNFMKMVHMTQSLERKLRNARHSSQCASDAFIHLDASIPAYQREIWAMQERDAQEKRISDPSAMDIFDVQVNKGEG